MQRTVYGKRFTYAKNTINEKGELTAELATIEIPEKDEKRAYKMASKQIGNFAPLKVEDYSKLYVLDDDIFFKYAKEKTADSAEGETADSAEA